MPKTLTYDYNNLIMNEVVISHIRRNIIRMPSNTYTGWAKKLSHKFLSIIFAKY